MEFSKSVYILLLISLIVSAFTSVIYFPVRYEVYWLADLQWDDATCYLASRTRYQSDDLTNYYAEYRLLITYKGKQYSGFGCQVSLENILSSTQGYRYLYPYAWGDDCAYSDSTTSCSSDSRKRIMPQWICGSCSQTDLCPDESNTTKDCQVAILNGTDDLQSIDDMPPWHEILYPRDDIALLVGYLGEDKPYSESEFIAMQVMCLGIMFGSAGLMFIIAIIIAIANCFGKCN